MNFARLMREATAGKTSTQRPSILQRAIASIMFPLRAHRRPTGNSPDGRLGGSVLAVAWRGAAGKPVADPRHGSVRAVLGGKTVRDALHQGHDHRCAASAQLVCEALRDVGTHGHV